MSPRGCSSGNSSSTAAARSSSAPYSRRSVSQPKSSRQQFSACGACRMRRVRCDLKDLSVPSIGPHPTCSNCKERGIKCVDEFADVKAVKLLRRGRRLQQVEAIYGKTADSDGGSLSYSARLSNIIPALQPEFFSSPFWRWFCIQRPILDPVEFPARFASHQKGEVPLGHEAGIITMLLVVWATSYGLNERGSTEVDGWSTMAKVDPHNPNQDGATNDRQVPDFPFNRRRQQAKEKSKRLLREILELVDGHGIMRKPSLDGVRVLLLLLPLMEDAKPLERLAIHEATLSQVQALCTFPNPSSVTSECHGSSQFFEDAATRARIFWYAYTHEGILTGVCGGRFVLNNDDLEAFQRTLPSLNFGLENGGLPSPPSPSSIGRGTAPLTMSLEQFPQHDYPTSNIYNRLISSSSLPLHLSNICRKIHAVLTGPKATRRAEEHNLIDALGMREIWRDLDRCWRELSSARRNAVSDDGDVASRLNSERYACAWQIFVFECHNVIRESLKQYMSLTSSSSACPQRPSSRPSSHSSSSSPYLSPHHLHAMATRKCLSLLPKVIRIIQHCLVSGLNSDESGIFVSDCGLVRDGCFFAGFLAASVEENTLNLSTDLRSMDREEHEVNPRHLTSEDGVSICLSALSAMHWSFSKSEEREETIRMIWETRNARRQEPSSYHGVTYETAYDPNRPYAQVGFQPAPQPIAPSTSYANRPILPSLSTFHSTRRAESAPNTSCSTDDRGAHDWPSYTPPGTATSLTTSTGTGLSIRGSPEFSTLMPMPYKHQSDETFYHGGGDLDHFTYNVPVVGQLNQEPPELAAIANFSHRNSTVDRHTANYISSPFTSAVAPAVGTSGNDFNSCPQFPDHCNATYR